MKNKLKKLIALIITYLILIIISTTSTFAALTELQEKATDLNHDGKRDIRDLDLIVSQPFPERVKDGVEPKDENVYYIFRDNGIMVDADDYVVDTSQSDKSLILDESKLEKAIKSLYSGEAEDNLMSVVKDGSFMKLQEEYNVNAVFAIAVTTIESSCGTAWVSIPKYTHNWISMSGSYKGRTVGSQDGNPLSWRVYDSYGEATLDFGDQIANNPYYFQAGKYSVKEIAPTYCNVQWGESVVSIMTNIYNAAGVRAQRKAIGAKNGNCVQYYQGDYSNIPYGDGNIGNCGCGPTSFAMVASTLMGTTITPEDAVTWCGNLYYLPKHGTNWSYFEAATKHFNLPCSVRQSSSISDAVDALQNGKFVISSQNAGLFTTGGHFIVLTGIDGDGGISVNDPNSANAIGRDYNNRKFTSAEIGASGAQYFIFE